MNHSTHILNFVRNNTCSAANHLLFSLVALLATMTACGGNQPSSELVTENPGGLNRCTLLTADEVTQVIGAHAPGKSDFENEWALQSCRWIATKVQKSSMFPDGWSDSIEAAVFEPDKVAWIKDQASGAPVKGVVAGAVYDSMSGQVWFSCGAHRYCVLKLRTYSPQNREENAIKLAHLMASRVP
jgi:hypothetical protein